MGLKRLSGGVRRKLRNRNSLAIDEDSPWLDLVWFGTVSEHTPSQISDTLASYFCLAVALLHDVLQMMNAMKCF